MNDGWDDEDDALGLLDEDDLELPTAAAGCVSPSAPWQQQSQQSHSESESQPIHPRLSDNAWEEDEDLLDLIEDEDDDHGERGAHPPNAMPQGGPPQKEPHRNDSFDWGEEEEEEEEPTMAEPDASRNITGSHHQGITSVPPTTPSLSPLVHQLHAYLSNLPQAVATTNATFAQEYNTHSKVLELMDYYTERPQLIDYTIDTELPRMDYRFTDTDGTVWLTSNPHHSPELAARLRHAASQSPIHSLLIRSANQSLLADPLQVIHGHTSTPALVRHDLLATCVAHQVTVAIRLPQPAMVQVQAQLQVLVPSQRQRNIVATIDLNVAFAAGAEDCVHEEPPFVEYRVAHLQLAQDWEACLEPWASFLQEQQHGALESEDEWLTMQEPQVAGMGAGNFRDVFVQHSQTLLQSSAVGMQTAWKEVQAATGLTNKLPVFLPTDVLQRAHEEELHTQQQQVSLRGQARQPKQRPTSILGGLVKKGWTQLAKSVALPEEDETLYQAWQPQPSHQTSPATAEGPSTMSSGLQLYRQERPMTNENQRYSYNDQIQRTASSSPPALMLYRKDEPEPGSSIKRTASSSPPTFTLYRKDEPDSAMPIQRTTSSSPPTVTLYRKDEPITFMSDRFPSHDETFERNSTSHPPQQQAIYGSLTSSNERLSEKTFSNGSPTNEALQQPQIHLYRRDESVEEAPGNVKPTRAVEPISDGWDEDYERLEGDRVTLETGTTRNPSPSSKASVEGDPSGLVAVNWHYDPETDIRPTRKRWVNPFPGPRRLQPMNG